MFDLDVMWTMICISLSKVTLHNKNCSNWKSLCTTLLIQCLFSVTASRKINVVETLQNLDFLSWKCFSSWCNHVVQIWRHWHHLNWSYEQLRIFPIYMGNIGNPYLHPTKSSYFRFETRLSSDFFCVWSLKYVAIWSQCSFLDIDNFIIAEILAHLVRTFCFLLKTSTNIFIQKNSSRASRYHIVYHVLK